MASSSVVRPYTLDNEEDKSSLDTLLEKEDFEGLQREYRAQSFYRRNERSILWNCSLFILNMIVCIGYTHWLGTQYAHFQPTFPSPAHNAIEYEGKQLDLSGVYLPNGTLNPDKPAFNGKPTPDTAAAWKSIMQHQNIALPKEALGPFSKEEGLVKLSDGSGYMSTLAVFHGLHCLKRLHHYVHQDSYYPELDAEGKDRLLFHTEHCIDWLRQYVQCNADTTLIPFFWGSKQKSPLAVDKGKHQCVKWEALDEWASERSFDAFTPGLLIHPVYGDPYNDNGERKGDTIGIVVGDHPLDGDHHDHMG